MSSTVRHSWLLTVAEAIALQRDLAGRVREAPLERPVRTVGAVDCALRPGGRELIAAAVVMDAASLEIVAQAYAVAPLRMPYIPGLLSFREAPAELEAVDQLPVRPDLLLVDGSGRAHPRRLGIASHLGLWLTIPTVGLAKSRLCGQHRPVGPARGDRADLVDRGELIGAVLRTRANVKPVYVSVGNRITLDQAVDWALRTCGRTRLPEPIRAADRLAGQLKSRLS